MRVRSAAGGSVHGRREHTPFHPCPRTSVLRVARHCCRSPCFSSRNDVPRVVTLIWYSKCDLPVQPGQPAQTGSTASGIHEAMRTNALPMHTPASRRKPDARGVFVTSVQAHNPSSRRGARARADSNHWCPQVSSFKFDLAAPFPVTRLPPPAIAARAADIVPYHLFTWRPMRSVSATCRRPRRAARRPGIAGADGTVPRATRRSPSRF